MPNPKDYPYWPRLVELLKATGERVLQIGLEGEALLTIDYYYNLKISKIKELIEGADLWISVDSFLPHLAHHIPKRGIVLWGPSDPRIFGYPENENLWKGEKYLRKDNFGYWENCTANPEAFYKPEEVMIVVGAFLVEV
jgi:ADP-heptose:LPS heptosyltransferase